MMSDPDFSSPPPWSSREDDVSAGQGDAGDYRGFEGEGAEVFRLQVVHVALAAGAGQDLNLGRDGVKPVGDALGAGVDVEAFRQLGILRRDADGTAAGMAVMAMIGRGPQSVIILDIKRLVAVEGDQGGRADVNGVGAQGQGL